MYPSCTYLLLFPGRLESSFSDVEVSLLALEDTIDARELLEEQMDQRFQLEVYQAKRKAEYEELSSEACDMLDEIVIGSVNPMLKSLHSPDRLQASYDKKKSEFENRKHAADQERREAHQRAFQTDMAKYTSGDRLQGN